MRKPDVAAADVARLPITIISLPCSAERRLAASRALGAVGLQFRFFDAIDGLGDGGAHFVGSDAKAFVRHTGREPTAGEHGCYASHLAVWRECVSSATPMIIMEDDFRLLRQFPSAVAVAARHIERLGFLRLQTERAGRKIACGRLDGFRLWRYTKAPQGAMCYAISPRVATALIAQSDVFRMPVDVLIKRFWEHGQPLYGLTPYVAAESVLSWETTIAGRRKRAKSLSERVDRCFSRLSAMWSRHRYNVARWRLRRRASALPAGQSTLNPRR